MKLSGGTPHYKDVRPEYDHTQRSLIGRAIHNKSSDEYDVVLQYDMRDPANWFLNRVDPNLVNCSDANVSAGISGRHSVSFAPNQLRQMSDAGVIMGERRCHLGDALEFSVVADLKPMFSGSSDLVIDFSKPMRPSEYLCMYNTIDEQDATLVPLAEKYGSMAMQYTEQFRKERDALRPKRPQPSVKEAPPLKEKPPASYYATDEGKASVQATTERAAALVERARKLAEQMSCGEDKKPTYKPRRPGSLRQVDDFSDEHDTDGPCINDF